MKENSSVERRETRKKIPLTAILKKQVKKADLGVGDNTMKFYLSAILKFFTKE